MRAAADNVTWFKGCLGREERELLQGHKGYLVWLTGLSASGKSTIAHLVEKKLYEFGCRTYVLDGDNIRHGLCGDLGFSPADRSENIRRIGEVARLFVDAGIIVLGAFISPYRKDRQAIRSLMQGERLIEVYIDCPAKICAQRDPKGLYYKAFRGEIEGFTGVSAPFEPPEAPDLVIKTDQVDQETAAGLVMELLMNRVFSNIGIADGFSSKPKPVSMI
jgi:adenylylsulfate kinase